MYATELFFSDTILDLFLQDNTLACMMKRRICKEEKRRRSKGREKQKKGI